ncbi:uncharacterized protein LOC116118767 [Pistacia vera]|uniref:uncharacterized protein LOC116118767 n=1 Tax=Pistacia vera TaxID=55513 RepID=UPI001263CD80|nr:uncharacterized protein LOC116118767 [Pistacia vera]
MSTKFELEKFTGENDFGLWKMKMEAVLIKEGLPLALKEETELPETMTASKKQEMLDKAKRSLILGLGDKVLQEVKKEKTVDEIWNRLNSLYRSKTVPNRLFLKQGLFGFKMDEQKSLKDNKDDFLKVIQDLESISVDINDEDQARDCPKRKNKKKSEKDSEGGSAGLASEGYESSEVLVISEGKTSEEWMLDSGCTYHMTPNREWFSSFQPLDGEKVMMGNNVVCHIKGTVKLNLQSGAANGSLSVMKGSLVVMKSEKRNGLYVLKGRVESGIAVVGSTEFKIELHCGIKDLHTVKFEFGQHYSSLPLEYVHSDVWGPSRHYSLGGCRYFISFVDDFSRYV